MLIILLIQKLLKIGKFLCLGIQKLSVNLLVNKRDISINLGRVKNEFSQKGFYLSIDLISNKILNEKKYLI